MFSNVFYRYKIRLTRQEINCLQNDYKEVIENIDKQGFSLTEETKEVIRKYHPIETPKTFLKITQVDSGSPSHTAGLEKNDELIQFGPYNLSNSSRDLKEIAEYVKEREEKIVLLKVLRKDEILRLKLIPKKWQGHGLLGCKLNFIQ